MGMVLFPWQMFCTNHVFGREQHRHDGGLSSCELRRIAMQQPGEHLLPPPECHYVSLAVNEFEQPQNSQVVPIFQTVIVAAVLFNVVNFEIPEQPPLYSPDPNCRSATLLSDSPLRGPPLV